MPKTQNSLNARQRAKASLIKDAIVNIQCDLCRHKFDTLVSTQTSDLRAHRGHRKCRIRQAERARRKPSTSQTSSTKTTLVAAQPGSVPITDAPQGITGHPAVIDASDSWTKKCDLCEELIKLGKSSNDTCFEAHRGAGVCQKSQRALKERRKLHAQKNLMGHFLQSPPSQDKVQGSSSKKGLYSALSPSVPVAEEKETLTNTKAVPVNQDLKPSDANLATLARDIRRALADIPTGRKRNHIEEGEEPRKIKKAKRAGGLNRHKLHGAMVE